ncbi:HNH endonuclease family protein [Alteromonas lipotrueae]|uniref:HNH endonuclease family protein n=1 Tax=Alteromonas lipotrueae TaxID=2803814 RepID=UPI001C472E40|nr:HNH endonuclease family protein [Alteromonas lipotrueae]
MNRNIPILFLLSFILSCGLPNNAYTQVKKSNSGICHDSSSASYNRTKKFEAFSTIEACLDSGGRLPKAQSTYQQAEKEASNEGRAFTSEYDRADWPHWIDDDNDCQNTRHEMLVSTSSIPVEFKTDKGCQVAIGEWYDPYSGDIFTDSTTLDLDHIVPLKFAHGHGGDKWSRDKRQIFANDPQNLLLVKASLYRQKGAKGLDEWLPPNHAYRCKYIAKFMEAVDKYGLQLIPSEKRVISKMRSACNTK